MFGVENYRACATSAIREAHNGNEVIAASTRESGKEVEVIDGKQEVAIIVATDLKEIIRPDQSYLYKDVGDGSTEFTLFTDGKIKLSKSIKLPKVRLLNNMVGVGTRGKLQEWISAHVRNSSKLSISGSGGNINKLHKMFGRKESYPLSYIWLNVQYHFLESLGYDERISKLGLNPDRVDVIIPATCIFLSAAKWSGAKKIYVPKIGLSDVIIKELYYSNYKV